jgi:hypothetical protein
MINEFAKSTYKALLALCCKAVINALLSHKETVRKQNALSKANKKECKKEQIRAHWHRRSEEKPCTSGVYCTDCS